MDARNLSKYLATSFNGRCKSDEQLTASVLFLSRVDHVTELSELEFCQIFSAQLDLKSDLHNKL